MSRGPVTPTAQQLAAIATDAQGVALRSGGRLR